MGNPPSRFDESRWLNAALTIENDVKRLTEALTEDQFHAPPRTGGWSVGYCIEHLLLTGQAFVNKCDKALAGLRAEAHVQAKVSRYYWLQRKILQFAEDPSIFKRKTDAKFVPYARHSRQETVNRLCVFHRELANRVASSGELNARSIKTESPFFPGFRFSMEFAFDLALAHERRHIRQAKQAWRRVSDDR